MDSKVSKTSVKSMMLTVDSLYEQLKIRLLGQQASKVGKGLIISHEPYKNLGSLVVESATAAGSLYSRKLADSLETITKQYIDAAKERTKAKVLQAVQTHGSTPEQLQESLESVFEKAVSEAKTLVATEVTTARNLSSLDAIGRIAATKGIEDPTVYWIAIKDSVTCKVCLKLYLQPNGITPRVWKMSQLQGGYYKKGMDAPTFAPVHPSCRCQPTMLLPNFGFSQSGHVEFKGIGWNEWKEQNS